MSLQEEEFWKLSFVLQKVDKILSEGIEHNTRYTYGNCTDNIFFFL